MKIHDAVIAGDLDAVARLVAEKPKRINLRNKKGSLTPLLLAIDQGKFDVVHWLVEHGADVNKTKYERYSEFQAKHHDSPIAFAIEINRPDLVSLFLQRGAALPDDILYFCVEKGRPAIVRILIDAGAPLDRTFGYVAPLHLAIESNHVDIAEMLIEAGADIHLYNFHSDTSLHCACAKGHLGLVKLMLVKNPRLDIGNGMGATPLAVAEENHQTAIAEFLRGRGARELKVKVRDVDLKLLVAARDGKIEDAMAALAAGADIHAGDICNRTALHRAVDEGQMTMIRFLLDRGAKFNNRMLYWESKPLVEALRNRQPELIEAFVKSGIAIDWSRVDPFPKREVREETIDAAELSTVDFWNDQEDETPGHYYVRINCALKQHGFSPFLEFLNSCDENRRALVLKAMQHLRAENCNDAVIDKVLEMLRSDASLAVRALAASFFSWVRVERSRALILELLSSDEVVRRGLLKEPSENDSERRLAANVHSVVVRLDIKEAVSILMKMGYRSSYVDCFTPKDVITAPFPEQNVGEYVDVSVGHTPLMPDGNEMKGPLCPGCNHATALIINLKPPFGPRGFPDGISFYRCLRCLTHTPFFVQLGRNPVCIEKPDTDANANLEMCGAFPEIGTFSVRWEKRTPEHEVWTYTPLLGGVTDWVQYDETPACPQCKAKMQFVVKLGGTDRTFPVVEHQGVLYGFWCGQCKISSTQYQVS